MKLYRSRSISLSSYTRDTRESIKSQVANPVKALFHRAIWTPVLPTLRYKNFVRTNLKKLTIDFKPTHKTQFRSYYFNLLRQTVFENFPVGASLTFILFNGELAVDLPSLELLRGLLDALGS